jgi:hypothetical protein
VTVSVGSNKLTRIESLDADLTTLLARESRFGEVPGLWDGRTGRRVVDALMADRN